MRSILLLATFSAALMTGCAGIETAVRAQGAHDFGLGARTYAFAGEPSAAADADEARYESAITHRLADLGYALAPEQTARYRLALSHDSRPASVAIADSGCTGAAPCGVASAPRAPGIVWPGQKTFVHSLTLRFFDRADGHEAYRVSVTKRDREQGSDRALAYLVASALARLPFAGGEGSAGAAVADQADWKIKLSEDSADAPPHVTSIAPLPR